MSRGTRRPSTGAALAGAAVLLLAALGLAVPATSGAFTARITNTADSAGASSRFTCATTFSDSSNAGNAYFEYALTGQAATAPDSSTAGNIGSFQPNGSHPTGQATASTACPNDPGSFYAPDGSTNWLQTAQSVGVSPVNITLAIWFSTTAAGGYLVGLNSAQTCDGAVYDRQIYLDTSGRVVFGVYSSAANTVASTASYNDGKWHQAVATFSGTSGIALWVDGQKVGSDPAQTTTQSNTGYWCVAQGKLGGWPNAPTSTAFRGGLRFAAAYRTVLSDSEIAAEYRNGRPTA